MLILQIANGEECLISLFSEELNLKIETKVYIEVHHV
jgi:hypothetical protein